MEETFRFFIRKEWGDKMVAFRNNELDELCADFKVYLDSKLTDEAKELIIPKGEAEVIFNWNNPLKKNGFHPAYYLHFTEYLKTRMDECSN